MQSEGSQLELVMIIRACQSAGRGRRGSVLGYRVPIGLGCKDGAPDVTDVDADILWYCVVSEDLDGLSDAAGIPVFNAGDELGLVPVDLVVFGAGLFDDSGLL